MHLDFIVFMHFCIKSSVDRKYCFLQKIVFFCNFFQNFCKIFVIFVKIFVFREKFVQKFTKFYKKIVHFIEHYLMRFSGKTGFFSEKNLHTFLQFWQNVQKKSRQEQNKILQKKVYFLFFSHFFAEFVITCYMYFSRKNLQEKITIYFIYFIQFFMKYLLFEKLVDTFCTKTHEKKHPFFSENFRALCTTYGVYG